MAPLGPGPLPASCLVPWCWTVRGELAGDPPVARAGLRLYRQPLAYRVEDRHALADQPGGDLAEAVGAVEHAHVGAGQPGRRLLDDQRQLVDEQLVERDAVVGRGRLGLDAGALGVRQGEDPDPLGLGLGGLDHLGDQLLLPQLGLLLGQLGLGGDDRALCARLRQRPGLGRLGLRLVHLGLVLRLHDGGFPAELGLLAGRRLLRLRRRLVGLRLRDLGLALDGGVVRRGHGGDVPGPMSSIDWICSESAISPRVAISPFEPSSTSDASFCRSVTISSTVIEPMIERRWPAKIRPVRMDIWSWSDRKRCPALTMDSSSLPTLNAITARTFSAMP